MIVPFFTTLFPQPEDGRDRGYVVVAAYPQGVFDPKEKPTKNQFFAWPSQKDDLLAFCIGNRGWDLYTCAALFKTRSDRKATNISHQWAVFADADALDLRVLKAEPTMVVETSPGRHHLYWVTPTDDPQRLTEISRSIAYTHAEDGCDTSAWDLGQLLRIPITSNTEYGQTFEVRLTRQGDLCSPDLLEELYPPVEVRVPVLVGEAMPTLRPGREVTTEASRALALNTNVNKIFHEDAQEGQDPSGATQRMLSELSRMGVSKEAAFYLAWNAKCNTYRTESRSEGEVWQEVCAVYSDPLNTPVRNSLESGEKFAKLGEEPASRALFEEDERNPERRAEKFVESISLLTPDELLQVPTNTFVDDYEQWAVTQTDAPMVYHRAGALMLLSAIFGEYGCCPVPQKTNLTLWFLMLGPTTRARKTTSMMLWVDLLEEMAEEDFSYILGSDVTPESLLKHLPSRDGRTSLVYRDEAHGWLYEQDSKRYLTGLPELMTELYNGRVRVRVRATESLGDEDNRPKKSTRTNFVLFLCGTVDQITRKLTIEKYESGEMHRYLVAEADAPPLTRESMWFEQYDGGEEGEDVERTALLNRLTAAKHFWHDRTKSPVRVFFEPQAWTRYMNARIDIVEMAQRHHMAEVMTTNAMRMADSLMKCAVLIAMAERETKVKLGHVLKAISLAEEWYAASVRVLGKVLHSTWAMKQEEIWTAIRSRPDGITQQELYGRFMKRLQEKEIEEALSMLTKARHVHKDIRLGRIRYIPLKKADK